MINKFRVQRYKEASEIPNLFEYFRAKMWLVCRSGYKIKIKKHAFFLKKNRNNGEFSEPCEATMRYFS